MNHRERLRRPAGYQWRVFDRRSGELIEKQFREGSHVACPLCGSPLEASPTSRLGRCVVLDAPGYDLNCRDCRRFVCVVRHTPRSIRLLRMRRLLAAVKAAARPDRRHRSDDSREATVA